ncbi:MAG: FAD-binding protein [Rhodospirillaceae bacterium]|nr:FAD-binding protein [Rhodospirillaceae bacterium]
MSSATTTRIGDSALAARLRRETEGDVLFDAFSRGRYSTDASHYQIEPIGVLVPKTEADIHSAIQIAAKEGVPVLPRGGGTSQCGQTVGEALVVDVSKHFNNIVDLDPDARRVTVQPGVVLDQLNNALAPHRLSFPVDVSTSSRATIGGMTANNSCGARSIVHGTMRDNVAEIEAILADGTKMHFGPLPPDLSTLDAPTQALARDLLALGDREKAEIAARFPDLMRRVGGYNIDALVADGRNAPVNLAHLLVGSEGTLGFSTEIALDLTPIPTHKLLGICHFPDFYAAMDSTQHIVKLGPAAVELADKVMIDLARDIPIFRQTIETYIQGDPAAILLVEFAGEDRDDLVRRMAQLEDLMGELGFPGGVVQALEPAQQKAVWEVRKSGLNIMMSMKGDGKPISFIEDCAVRLEDLADYTDRLTKIFHDHGTEGTWYAHASVGCLHVRPVVNLKQQAGAEMMRDIAEKAFEIVREYKGSHSGEHGDGLVRSEFHEAMFGTRMTDNFAEVKRRFDPAGLFNPGKITNPPKMDDRSLFRFKPGYAVPDLKTAFDWSDWGGLGAAVEMCNNNGACRKFDAAVMCPSFRATGEEQHLTRGRANSLRLALSGQLGDGALTSDAMYETMKLCVGCKGCKRECPTGVDMAKMKTEFLYHYTKERGLSLHDRLVSYLPRYAPWAAKLGGLLNLRDKLPGLAKLSEAWLGFSAKRALPRWRRDHFECATDAVGPADGTPVVFLADTFNRWFEPENARAAVNVLMAAGYRVHLPTPHTGSRPLCCGRTFLASGLVDEAKAEIERTMQALAPFLDQGMPVIGLEPSCLFTFRDEVQSLLPGAAADRLAESAMLFEEFVARERAADRFKLDLQPAPFKKALLHGHCHQKAFAAMSAVESTLRLIPGLEVKTVASSCCGMAGAFGYRAENYDISMKMGEMALLPAMREASADTVLVADGTSCRHQIADGTDKEAVHVARLLEAALPAEARS